MPAVQGKHWILTIPAHEFVPYLPEGLEYVKGQLEEGAGGFIHWQVYIVFSRNARLTRVRSVFGPVHAELTRSEAAREYVWKEDTRVDGTQFELGRLPVRRSVATDWDSVFSNARAGRLEDVPSDIRVRCYNQLRRIAGDYLEPAPMEREVFVYWGDSGAGKSRRAWQEAGFTAYPKDPRSKFWDGYRGHPNVVIDEFRGGIDISHILRWLDRYPVLVEVKGSSSVLSAQKIWITSNLHPRDWYPDLDAATVNALIRRLTIVHFTL